VDLKFWLILRTSKWRLSGRFSGRRKFVEGSRRPVTIGQDRTALKTTQNSCFAWCLSVHFKCIFFIFSISIIIFTRRKMALHVGRNKYFISAEHISEHFIVYIHATFQKVPIQIASTYQFYTNFFVHYFSSKTYLEKNYYIKVFSSINF
jgi:hypothetical protein